MDYKAKLDEMATEMYREFDLDGQDDYERAKAFLRAHFPEPAKDARELADLVWDIVHEAGGPYSEQSGLQQIVDAIERFVQARLAARGQEGAREGFLEAAADAGIGQAANSVDLARKWQARAEKVESEARALRETLREMWPFIEEDDLGGYNTPAFNRAFEHYRAALTSAPEAPDARA
jgi:hypothetical protein